MAGFSTPAAAISKLSQLDIDIDKDWGAHRITNLGAPVAATDALPATMTTHGDVLFRGAAAPQRLGAGTAGKLFTTMGPGADLAWGDPPMSADAQTLVGEGISLTQPNPEVSTMVG